MASGISFGQRDKLTRRLYLQGLVFLWISVLFSVSACNARDVKTVRVQFENLDGTKSPVITSELAFTAGDRSLGLMYRKEMADDAGMLFLFPDEAARSFWMENTFLPLDIIFVRTDFSVVSIAEKAIPHTQTPRPSAGPARYVVEVLGGKSAAWGVKSGSKLSVLDPLPIPQ